jgi:predicted AAA+ superfamily ATPase
VQRRSRVKIVEVAREDLPSIGRCLRLLRDAPGRFVLFCDDLSFRTTTRITSR